MRFGRAERNSRKQEFLESILILKNIIFQVKIISVKLTS